jgi:hypothetical protein
VLEEQKPLGVAEKKGERFGGSAKTDLLVTTAISLNSQLARGCFNTANADTLTPSAELLGLRNRYYAIMRPSRDYLLAAYNISIEISI